MKSWYIASTTLFALGIAASVLLIPHSNELGLMFYRDKEFSRSLYIFEKQWEEGDHSAQVVVPLARLYLQYGQVDHAVELMEDFVKEHPSRIQALQILGQFYQYAQRPNGYLKTLEQLRILEPTPQVLRDLSAIYNFQSEYEKQVDVLKQLNSLPEASTQDSLDLCHLLASLGHYQEAAEAVVDFCEQHPQKITGELLELTASLVLESQKIHADHVLSLRFQRLGSQFFENPKNITLASRIARVFLAQNRPELGLKLLRPLESLQSPLPSSFFIALVELRLASGEKETVYQWMWEQFEKKQLHPDLSNLLVYHLIEERDVQRFKQVFEENIEHHLDIGAMTNSALFSMTQKIPLIPQKIRAQVSEEEIEYYPLLFLLCQLASTPPSTSLQLDQLPFIHELSLQELSMALEAILSTPFRKGLFPLAQRLAQSEKLPPDLFVPIIEQLLQTKQVKEAEQLLTLVQKKSEGPQWNRLWAFLLLSQNREEECLHWISQITLSEQTLEDLYYQSQEKRLFDLALAIAKHLNQHFPSPSHELFIAQIYFEKKQFHEALPWLRPHKTLNAEFKSLYEFALMQSIDQHPELKEELHPILLQQIKQEPSIKKRLELAYLLLDKFQDKTHSLPIFWEAAKEQPLDSPQVQQLLYLWGPRPPAEAMTWLVKRAKSESRLSKKLEWGKVLVSTGAYSEAIELLQSFPSPEVIHFITETLILHGDISELRQYLSQTMSRVKDLPLLLGMAKIAREHELLQLYQDLLDCAYVLFPSNTELLLTFGLFSYEKGNYPRAYTLLKQYDQRKHLLPLSEENKERFFLALSYLAELQWQKKEEKEALRTYRQLLEFQKNHLPQKDLFLRIEALAQDRLGNRPKALRIYKKLLKKYPSDKELRATIAHLLLDEKQYSEAESILFFSREDSA